MANDSKALSQERFNRYAQAYVHSKTHAKGAELERLIDIANPQSDWIALDVATGGGHTALKFAPHVAKVMATDLAPKMLEAVQEHITGKGIKNVEFRLADAEDLPFENASFDLVTCRIAPHHFPDAAKFVRECARVLKSGGLLLVQDQYLSDDETAAQYMDNFEKLRDPGHNHAFTANEWRTMLENAGLTVEHIETFGKRHNFLSWTNAQNCPPNIVAQLESMLRVAPPSAAEWLQAKDVGTPQASFVNHHIIIAGRN